MEERLMPAFIDQRVLQKQSNPKTLEDILREVGTRHGSLKPVLTDSGKVFLEYSVDDLETKKRIDYSAVLVNELSRRFMSQNKIIAENGDSLMGRIYNNYNTENLRQYELELATLGYDFSVRRLAIVLRLENLSNVWSEIENCDREEVIRKWKRRVSDALNTFFTKNRDMIVAYVGNDRFLILKSVEDRDEHKIKVLIKKSYRAIFRSLLTNGIDTMTLGFSNSYQGVDGIAQACKEAEAALKLGSSFKGAGGSYFYNEFGSLSSLVDGDLSKKTQMAERMISKLNDKDLEKTLTVFLEKNLNMTETALKLKIHRNTVIYRIEQIADRLGLDPRNFDEAVNIKLALFYHQLAS